jgi:hypothetical protein
VAESSAMEDDGEERQSPEQQELVSLTGVLEIVDAEHGIVKWIEPPDRPEDETGVREPRTPRPQAPSASALPSTD